MHCAVCLLAMSHSDQQCGCNLRGDKNTGTQRGQSTLKKAKRRVQKHVHTVTCLVLRIIYLVLLYARKKAQRRIKQHRTAGQGTAPHGIARRYAAVSYINQAPTSFKTPPSPHRIFDLKDSLDKRIHFLPQLSDFVALRNGFSSFRAQTD